NWEVLWLVAGGFALGYALSGTGLAKSLIESIDFSSMSIIVVFIVAGLICYLLSNFISNSATAALLIPIMIAMGKGLLESSNADAFIAFGGQAGLSVFVAVCASVAMCLPISTPPNAIAASTGLVETKDMTKVGLIVGIVGLVLGFFWVTKFFPFA
ncbi:MAG: anion permease, partial [Bacteroidales bacterium]|nr:anion permease [Bacteroidales bacterium]